MNKIRRLAEDLVTRYPSLFTNNFDKNKQALAQVSVIHARSIRNQLAGAITRLVQERGPEEEGADASKELTIGEQIIARVEQESQKAATENTQVKSSPQESGEPETQAAQH